MTTDLGREVFVSWRTPAAGKKMEPLGDENLLIVTDTSAGGMIVMAARNSKSSDVIVSGGTKGSTSIAGGISGKGTFVPVANCVGGNTAAGSQRDGGEIDMSVETDRIEGFGGEHFDTSNGGKCRLVNTRGQTISRGGLRCEVIAGDDHYESLTSDGTGCLRLPKERPGRAHVIVFAGKLDTDGLLWQRWSNSAEELNSRRAEVDMTVLLRFDRRSSILVTVENPIGRPISNAGIGIRFELQGDTTGQCLNAFARIIGIPANLECASDVNGQLRVDRVPSDLWISFSDPKARSRFDVSTNMSQSRIVRAEYQARPPANYGVRLVATEVPDISGTVRGSDGMPPVGAEAMLLLETQGH
jgi:hypothetical protein